MKDSKVELSDKDLEVLLKEFTSFLDEKHRSGDKTTKGVGNLKYNICNTNKYVYKDFIVRGGIGQGNLRSGDLGMAFLYGKNTMKEGVYIWLTYRPEDKEIILKLGRSWTHDSRLEPEKKKSFNKDWCDEGYKNNLDYRLITKDISKLLDIFLTDKRTQRFTKIFCQEER